MDQHEITVAIERCVRRGLEALTTGDDAAADREFRRAVHLCADAGRVVREILRQTGGQLPRGGSRLDRGGQL